MLYAIRSSCPESRPPSGACGKSTISGAADAVYGPPLNDRKKVPGAWRVGVSVETGRTGVSML